MPVLAVDLNCIFRLLRSPPRDRTPSSSFGLGRLPILLPNQTLTTSCRFLVSRFYSRLRGIQFMIKVADEVDSRMTFLAVELDAVLVRFAPCARNEPNLSSFGLGDSPFFSTIRTLTSCGQCSYGGGAWLYKSTIRSCVILGFLHSPLILKVLGI
jgi:hypothetical protein